MIFSTNDDSMDVFSEVKSLIPVPDIHYKKGDKRVLRDGRILPKLNEKTTFTFEYSFRTDDINECNEKIQKIWSERSKNLQLITAKFNYKIELNYEITVYDLHYPFINFSQSFLNFLSTHSISMSHYFYND